MKSNDLHESFKKYIEEKWRDEDVHTQGDFTHIFSIDSRHSRYHLLKHVQEGTLCSVKYKGRVYYVKRKHEQLFKQFNWIGVKVK